MKLFDLSNQEIKLLKMATAWHLSYIALIGLFFSYIYWGGYFRSNYFLKENFLFYYAAPLSTVIFSFMAPWRNKWARLVKDMRRRLDGEMVFCVMAGWVFFVGFYLYSLLLWGLGALGPSLWHM